LRHDRNGRSEFYRIVSIPCEICRHECKPSTHGISSETAIRGAEEDVEDGSTCVGRYVGVLGKVKRPCPQAGVAALTADDQFQCLCCFTVEQKPIKEPYDSCFFTFDSGLLTSVHYHAATSTSVAELICRVMLRRIRACDQMRDEGRLSYYVSARQHLLDVKVDVYQSDDGYTVCSREMRLVK